MALGRGRTAFWFGRTPARDAATPMAFGGATYLAGVALAWLLVVTMLPLVLVPTGLSAEWPSAVVMVAWVSFPLMIGGAVLGWVIARWLRTRRPWGRHVAAFAGLGAVGGALGVFAFLGGHPVMLPWAMLVGAVACVLGYVGPMWVARRGDLRR